MGRKKKRQKKPAAFAALLVPKPAAAAVITAWLAVLAVLFARKGVRPYPEDWTTFIGLLFSIRSEILLALVKDAFLTAGMWLIFIRAGSAVLDRLGLRGGHRAERWLLSGGIGAGSVSVLLLLLGLAGLWRPLTHQVLFFAGLAACAGLEAYRRLRPPPDGQGEGSEAGPPRHPAGTYGPFEWAALALIGCAAVLNVLATATPEIFYDSLVYHLSLPKLYLLRGHIMPTPENCYSGIPFGLQMLYGPALALSGENLAALLHCSFGLATGLALWAWTRRFASVSAGVLAALVFYLCPVVLYGSWYCGVDLGASFYSLLALYAVCRFLSPEAAESGRTRAWSVCAGILTGLAMSTKYNVFPVGAALIVVHGWLGRRTERPLRDTVWMAGTAAAVLAPWLVKNVAFYGNPLYPFLYEKIGWAKVADWPGFMGAAGSRPLSATFGSLKGFFDFLLFPWTVSLSDWPMGDWPGPAFILIAPWAVLLRWHVLRKSEDGAGVRDAWLAALALAVAGCLAWCLSSHLVRYVVPALPFIALAAALAVEKGEHPVWLRRAGWVAVLIACGFDFQAAFRQGGLIGSWSVLTGKTDRYTYLTTQRVTYGLPYYSAARFINENTPEDAKVLLLGESRAYYLERDFVAATVFDYNPFWAAVRGARTPAELRAKAREMGITHVLMSARQLLYRKESENVFPEDIAGGDLVEGFWRGYLKRLFTDREDGGKNPRWLTVYEVLDEAREDPTAGPRNPARFVVRYLERKRRRAEGGGKPSPGPRPPGEDEPEYRKDLECLSDLWALNSIRKMGPAAREMRDKLGEAQLRESERNLTADFARLGCGAWLEGRGGPKAVGRNLREKFGIDTSRFKLQVKE